jgi:hypothetical protein
MADAPIKALQVVQRGVQASIGTGVAATHRVNINPGTAELDHNIEKIRRRFSGSLATSHQGTQSGPETYGVLWEERLTYDGIVAILQSLLAPTTAGTGAGADKVWAFTPSDNADNVKRHTLELGGKDTWPSEFQLVDCIVKSLEITFAKNQPWMGRVEYRGKTLTEQAKTAALSMPTTLVEILGKTTSIAIDPTTIGNSVQGQLVSGSLKIEAGVEERMNMDGTAGPSRVSITGERTVTGLFVVEYNAALLRTAWKNSTYEKCRIKSTGPTLGGSTYLAQLDVYGTIDAAPIRWDGNVATLELSVTAEYDNSVAADIVASITNSLAAIP